MGFSALAAATVVGGVASAALGSSAAKSAANTQAASAQQATDAQLQMFNQSRQLLDPYSNMGVVAGNSLMSSMGLLPSGNTNTLNTASPSFTPMNYQAFNPTMQQLEATPGYQFTLNQGLKGVTNNLSAQGLVGSGAQGKALAEYATGLASNTYNQQLQNHLAQEQTRINTGISNFQTDFGADQANKTNIYNRLIGITGLGQSAAAGTGTLGQQTGANIGSNIIGAGNAQAAGTVGSSNAITGGINQAVGGVSNAYLINQLLSRSTPTGAVT